MCHEMEYLSISYLDSHFDCLENRCGGVGGDGYDDDDEYDDGDGGGGALLSSRPRTSKLCNSKTRA